MTQSCEPTFILNLGIPYLEQVLLDVSEHFRVLLELNLLGAGFPLVLVVGDQLGQEPLVAPQLCVLLDQVLVRGATIDKGPGDA